MFNLKEEILQEHSKAQKDKIVAWVGSSQVRFDQLFYLFLHGEYRIVQRAAWPVSYCVIAYPVLLKKHWPTFINNLQQLNLHNAVKRNSVRLLQHIEIPEAYQGDVMNICFDFVASPTEAVATKAFSLTVLANLSRQYPEILPEIKQLIADQLPYQTAAFKSRAGKIR